MPKPGQMTEECTVTTWFKREGDPVARGDVLFEIETDKSTMEVEAFDDGVLLRRLVAEGETVPVNTICAFVGALGEAIPEAAHAPVASGPAPAPPAAPPPAAAATSEEWAARPLPSPAPGDRHPAISPRARRLAVEAGLDTGSLTGTGPAGRIVERDVRAAIEARDAAAPPEVRPSAIVPSVAIPAPLPGPAIPGEEAPRPLSRMRRIIADRLTTSWTTIPHFTITVVVDVTGLLDLRSELKAAGTNLTVTDFVLAATAQALAEFPDVNSRTDGVSVWPRHRVHLGLAVAVPGGLVVPVLRDADHLPLGEIHERAAALAAAAREGTLAVDDMTGSTFTVSNLGMLGVDEFSAIVNPGEAAILAVAGAAPTAVVIGDGLAVRSIMKLTLSADHRLVDGEQGARFLGAIRRRLEDVASFRDEALTH
jgi:pyruvate dehydrogenase E2 component (dihydrolipoamide acetyltransferase)